jgi:hypothetical protein
MTRLRPLYQCTSTETIVDFDINDQEAVAVIKRKPETIALEVMGKEWTGWQPQTNRHIHHVRWLTKDKLALYHFPVSREQQNSVCSVSVNGSQILPIGTPSGLLPARDSLYVWYGEEQTIGAKSFEPESQVLTLRSYDGEVLFGLSNYLEKIGYSGSLLQVSTSCVRRDGIMACSIYNLDDLFLIDPFNKNIEIARYSGEIYQISGMSVIERRIFLAKKTSNALEISTFHLEDNTMENVERITYDSISPNVTIKAISIRGMSNGNMAVATNNSIWVVELSQYAN